MQSVKEGRGYREKPGFQDLILEMFTWFHLKLSASEIQNLTLGTVKHQALYLATRDTASQFLKHKE